MELLRADTDLRAETELETVSESRRGIYIDVSRIDELFKFFCVVSVAGDDRVGMCATEFVDMLNRRVHVVDDSNAQNQIVVLG